MTYANYKKSLAHLSAPAELERLLSIAENDGELSDRGYYSIRNMIINKIYQ